MKNMKYIFDLEASKGRFFVTIHKYPKNLLNPVQPEWSNIKSIGEADQPFKRFLDKLCIPKLSIVPPK